MWQVIIPSLSLEFFVFFWWGRGEIGDYVRFYFLSIIVINSNFLVYYWFYVTDKKLQSHLVYFQLFTLMFLI